jgi:hypothetical protein
MSSMDPPGSDLRSPESAMSFSTLVTPTTEPSQEQGGAIIATSLPPPSDAIPSYNAPSGYGPPLGLDRWHCTPGSASNTISPRTSFVRGSQEIIRSLPSSSIPTANKTE